MKIQTNFFGEIKVDERLNSLFNSQNSTPEVVQPLQNQVKNEVAEKQEIVQEKELTIENLEEIEKIEEKQKENPENNHSTRKQKIQLLIDTNKKTLFVGNLNTQVLEKSNYKKLKTLFKTCGNVVSIRFRSIAFDAGKITRKQAFLAGKLHEKRDSLNAYVVYENENDAVTALALNGTVFMDRHLRVDFSETTSAKNARDNARCIFIGNLPFDISDEKVWEFFHDVGDIEYVRIIRDRKVNVGKGFGYVQFLEKSSVELALGLNGSKFCERNIRISRVVDSLAEKSKSSTKVIEGARASKDSGLKLAGNNRIRVKQGKLGAENKNNQMRAIKTGGISKKRVHVHDKSKPKHAKRKALQAAEAAKLAKSK